MNKKLQAFFWDRLAPVAAPVITNYHNDFYKHDRAAIMSMEADEDDELLWMVHDYGTHSVWKSSVLENPDYYGSEFIEHAWKGNHQGNTTVKLFWVSPKAMAIQEIGWDRAADFYREWLNKACRLKYQAAC
jgi:hypothetical protein